MPALRLSRQFSLSVLLASVLVFSGCEEKDKKPEPASVAQTEESSSTAQTTKEATGSQPNQAGRIKRGKSIYFAYCIACHNMDPAKVGSVGPAIRGSSKELLTLKVTQGAYPEGYQPKRITKLMPPLPNLKAGIPFLHAFLKP